MNIKFSEFESNIIKCSQFHSNIIKFSQLILKFHPNLSTFKVNLKKKPSGQRPSGRRWWLGDAGGPAQSWSYAVALVGRRRRGTKGGIGRRRWAGGSVARRATSGGGGGAGRRRRDPVELAPGIGARGDEQRQRHPTTAVQW
jgi:hypothetical protein